MDLNGAVALVMGGNGGSGSAPVTRWRRRMCILPSRMHRALTKRRASLAN
jgi:hypothetical protein